MSFDAVGERVQAKRAHVSPSELESLRAELIVAAPAAAPPTPPAAGAQLVSAGSAPSAESGQIVSAGGASSAASGQIVSAGGALSAVSGQTVSAGGASWAVSGQFASAGGASSSLSGQLVPAPATSGQIVPAADPETQKQLDIALSVTESLAGRLSHAQWRNNSYVAQNRRLRKSLAKEKAERKQSQKKMRERELKRGRKRRYLSDRGGLTIAARRRCLSNSGSVGVGMMLGMDLSGVTVRKWEIRLRAAMLASCRFWFSSSFARQHDSAIGGGLRAALIRARADATNAAILQKQKLNVVEFSAAFTHGQIFADSSVDPKDQQLRSE